LLWPPDAAQLPVQVPLHPPSPFDLVPPRVFPTFPPFLSITFLFTGIMDSPLSRRTNLRSILPYVPLDEPSNLFELSPKPDLLSFVSAPRTKRMGFFSGLVTSPVANTPPSCVVASSVSFQVLLIPFFLHWEVPFAIK